MAKTARFNIEGAVLDLPLRYDAASKMEVEIYPDLLENPVYTPSGERVMLTIEDACEFGKPLDDEPRCIDCGSCRYYRQSDDCLLGVCGNEKMRRPIEGEEERK